MVTTKSDLLAATDKELLTAYQRTRDHEAFSAIIERYHSMVLGIAQRMLGCSHSAEDVLQATFLVLAKDARKIRKRTSLASWLYGVAFRISARSAKQRARTNAFALHDEVTVSDDPLEKLSAQFEQNAVFEELHQLPESVRTPMVLRYVRGKSNAEVAEQMSLSESAVEGRLKRGRNQLRMKLARQGVTFAAAVTVLEAIKQDAVASEFPRLVAKTVEACLAGNAATGTQVLGNEVFRLAEEEILKMATTKLVSGAFVAMAALGVVAAGWGIAGSGLLLAQDGADPFGEVVVKSGAARAATADLTRVQIGSAPGSKTNSDPFADSFPEATQRQLLQARLKKLGYYSVNTETESEIRILEALEQKLRQPLSFQDEPLSNAVAVLRENYSIPILFDKQTLDDENVSTDEPISFEVDNIRFNNALKLMLDDLNLATIIRNEVLLITSKERAEATLVTRVYRHDPKWTLNPEELIDAITTSTKPDSWDDVGGPGSIMSVQDGLVISNTRAVHQEVNKLFAQLDQLYTQSAADRRKRNIGDPNDGF